MKTRSFQGGIRIDDFKRFTERKPIETLPPPPKAYLPLKQNAGSPSRPVVEIGAEVFAGEVIAAPSGAVSSTLHASVPGKVSAIADHPHPSGADSPAIVIETAAAGNGLSGMEPMADWEGAAPEEIRARVLEAGIVGMGGAGFPAQVKLEPPPGKKIETAVINAAECEPFLTVDHRLLLEETEKVVAGLKIIMRAAGAARGVVAVESNKADALDRLERALEKEDNIFAVLLTVKYPQGAEKQLLKTVADREVPSGGLPADVGCLVHNVHTAIAIADAVLHGRPLIERVVTVSGFGLDRPGNFRVRLGTPFSRLLEAAGGPPDGELRLIAGGPMTGVAQRDLGTPVIKSTTGLVVLPPLPRVRNLPCLRCGKCLTVCPMGLVPCDLARAAEKGRREDFAGLSGADCMECGCCAYVCPAARDLVQFIQLGKALEE